MMTASQRILNLLSGKPVDRLPIIEWAPYWNKTLDRWQETDGLPAEIKTDEQIQEYFGFDKCLRRWITCKTRKTPPPAGTGLGIMQNEHDYETIYPCHRLVCFGECRRNAPPRTSGGS